MGIMEKKMETTIVYWGYILGLCRDTGKETGSYRDYRGIYRGYIGLYKG